MPTSIALRAFFTEMFFPQRTTSRVGAGTTPAVSLLLLLLLPSLALFFFFFFLAAFSTCASSSPSLSALSGLPLSPAAVLWRAAPEALSVAVVSGLEPDCVLSAPFEEALSRDSFLSPVDVLDERLLAVVGPVSPPSASAVVLESLAALPAASRDSPVDACSGSGVVSVPAAVEEPEGFPFANAALSLAFFHWVWILFAAEFWWFCSSFFLSFSNLIFFRSSSSFEADVDESGAVLLSDGLLVAPWDGSLGR
mmetsp:Transcript_6739/g.16849  ORF Transcript_6739/g.16849 Transcript_6739/m.16849 type:complete len:252 (-) Transcript_6739:1072-1827(-)